MWRHRPRRRRPGARINLFGGNRKVEKTSTTGLGIGVAIAALILAGGGAYIYSKRESKPTELKEK